MKPCRPGLLIIVLLIFTQCKDVISDQPPIHPGMVLTQSIQLEKDTFHFADFNPQNGPLLKIVGENITIDFGGAVLIGAPLGVAPQDLKGTAIQIEEGRNIRIQNVEIKNFAKAITAINTDSLQIQQTTIHYNYRPLLKNTQKLDSLQQQPLGQAAIELRNCNHFVISENTIQHNRQGILLDQCQEGWLYYNNISFNSGAGILLIQSSRNQILHNSLDWNVIPSRNGSSGSLLIRDDIDLENIIAYNSMTHGGSNQSLHTQKRSTFWKNDYAHTLTDSPLPVETTTPIPPLPDAKPTGLSEYQLQGKEYILMDDWGPYNFKYPTMWLRQIQDNQYTFLLLGPQGNWKAAGGTGFSQMNPKRGTFPATIRATTDGEADALAIQLQFIGPAFLDKTGKSIRKGALVQFGFSSDKPVDQ